MTVHVFSLFLPSTHRQLIAFLVGMIGALSPEKAPAVGVFEEKRRKQMNLITHYELATKSVSELRGLYRKVFNALVQSAPGSAERRNVLASLENISRELNRRCTNQCRLDAGP